MCSSDLDMSVNTEPDPKGGDSAIVIRGKGRYANARTQFEARAGSLAAFRDVTVRYPVDLIWEVGNTRAHIVGTVLNRTNLAEDLRAEIRLLARTVASASRPSQTAAGGS